MVRDTSEALRGLTTRQREVLALLQRGLTNEEIARELGITLDGAKWHVSEIIARLGVRDRYEAAALPVAGRGRLARLVAPITLLGKTNLAPAAYVLSAAVLVLAAAGATALLWGIARNGSAGTGARVVAAGPLGKVAYIRDGDIWVKALPDGPDRRVLAAANSPDWSTSGEWMLVFADDQQQVLRADGSDLRTVGSGAVWAPDADVLTYVDADEAIIIERADGSDRRTVVPAPGVETERVDRSGLRWDPSGTRIAYAEQRTADTTPPWTYAGIWVADADGSDAHEVHNTGAPPQDGVVPLAWTPNGTEIIFALDVFFSASAFADGLPIYKVPVSSGTPRQLVPGMLIADDLRSPSPLGNLTIAITDGAGREMWRNKAISLLTWGSGNRIPLTDASTAAFAPSWSPDGQQLTYVAQPDAGPIGGSGQELATATHERHIWTMSAYDPVPGANQRQLTDDPAFRDERPQWSNDGATVLFARIDGEFNASLWTVPSAGGDPLRIVDAISPPGTWDSDFFIGYYGQVFWDQVLDWWQPPIGPPPVRTPLAFTSWNDSELGVSFEYPSGWIRGATPMPYASCVGCLIFGPESAPHPYGIGLFAALDMDAGCAPTCIFNIRALALDWPREMTIDGRRGLQQEFERQAPLGLADQTGDYTPYHELVTLIFREDADDPEVDVDALVIHGFWRDGDAAAEAEARAAYVALLDALRFDSAP